MNELIDHVKAEVLKRALSRIFVDVSMNDLTAVEELLSVVPKKNLLAFLDQERLREKELRINNPHPH